MQLLTTQWWMLNLSLSSDPPASFPQNLYCAWHHTVLNIPLASFGQLSWLCPHPASCAPSTVWELEKSVTTQLQLKYQWIIDIINPNHRTIPDTEKKTDYPSWTQGTRTVQKCLGTYFGASFQKWGDTEIPLNTRLKVWTSKWKKKDQFQQKNTSQ